MRAAADRKVPAAGRAPEAGELRRYRNPQDDNWHVQLMQGDYFVSADENEVLSTILGSCIAACIRDPLAGVGGMNHFLLPEGSGADKDAQRFGVNAMEILINGILSRGGLRSRLEAKLFGGANVLRSMSDVGSRNISFARLFLADEGIPVTGGDVGGQLPRRVLFWPVSGRARQLYVRADKRALASSEIATARRTSVVSDDVELF